MSKLQRDKIYDKIRNAICVLDLKNNIKESKESRDKHYSYELKGKQFAKIYISTSVWLVLPVDKSYLATFVKHHIVTTEPRKTSVALGFGNICSSIEITDEENFDEIVNVLTETYKQQNK